MWNYKSTATGLGSREAVRGCWSIARSAWLTSLRSGGGLSAIKVEVDRSIMHFQECHAADEMGDSAAVLVSFLPAKKRDKEVCACSWVKALKCHSTRVPKQCAPESFFRNLPVNQFWKDGKA